MEEAGSLVRETGLEDIDSFISFLMQEEDSERNEYVRAELTAPLAAPAQPPKIHPKDDEQYLELNSIAEGGMGEIWLAKDLKLGRKVAIKTMRSADTDSPRVVQRFVREAQITAQLDHPNVVPVYNLEIVKKSDRQLRFAMKLVQGRTLKDVLLACRARLRDNPKRPLPPRLALNARLEIFLKICEAVAYAHSKGVVHRDLKPANVMIGEFGEVYVMDWGIAKVRGKLETSDFKHTGSVSKLEHTQHGAVLGTPTYMAPEQAAGLESVGPHSDIYSLGLILQELVTLNRARWAQDRSVVEAMAIEGTRLPPTHFVEGRRLPPELLAIVSHCAEVEPSSRYQSVTHLMGDVRAYLRDDEVSVLPDSAIKRVWRVMNRHRQLTMAALFSVVTFAVLVVAWGLARENDAIETARWREGQITSLMADVSAHAHRIDVQFHRLADIAKHLADTAMFLLDGHEGYDREPLWWEQFTDPASAPTDFAMSPVYGIPISLDHPVAKAAPGVNRAELVPLLERISPLARSFREAMFESRVDREWVPPEERDHLISEIGVPIRWTYIGLEQGLMFSYPGKATYAASYDPRQRPWYQLPENSRGVVWGAPYLDTHGQGAVIPASVPLYDEQGQRLGVV
ncbi:MAG: protein kinase, partial [Myxococcales bacterium]|nr:protein kinase [Myxococcales bacterium]